MILEFGVIAACLGGYCNETGAAYYAANPLFRERVEDVKDQALGYLNPTMVRYAGPIAGAVFVQEATIDMGKSKAITVSVKDQPMVKFVWGF